MKTLQFFLGVFVAAGALSAWGQPESVRLPYNHAGLVVDLGVGLWAQPLPMDYDEDGDYDMVVATADVPYNGIYFFENPGGDPANPVFKPAVRMGDAVHNMTISYADDTPIVMTPNRTYPKFRTAGAADPAPLNIESPATRYNRARARQWKYVDYNGDEMRDLVIGLGVWDDYGWDDAWDHQGNWKNGPLHGYVYLMASNGRTPGKDEPPFYNDDFFQVVADGEPVDVYGAPSPNFADFDGDGDLDLLCGEFLDRLTYFENIGTREEPEYARGRFVEIGGERLHMDLQMLQVVALDWDKDGDTDVIVGEEDGRVAWLEHQGKVSDGVPVFAAPRYFQQEADAVKVGALATPDSYDWDGDGDEDLIVGNTAGYLALVENLDGGDPPKWAAPVYLKAGGETIRIQAGLKGSIQGPAEAKWGYTAPNVADWNHDGTPDIVVNSIWGKVIWYENEGTLHHPALKAAQPVRVAWEGAPKKPEWVWWEPEAKVLATQWRTTPIVHDWNDDGLFDLVMLDHEGYLAFFERVRRDGELMLAPGERVFMDEDGAPLRLNERRAGKSGRRKLDLVDWDGDGRVDLLENSESVSWRRNVSQDGVKTVFADPVRIDGRKLAGHTTSPTTVDWDRNGIPDLLTGAEDGFFYYLKNPRAGE